MANKTVHEFKIKLREDRVYDLYLDKKLIISRGSVEGVIEELKALREENV